MDNSSALKLMIVATTLIGMMGSIIPLVSHGLAILRYMLFSAAFYLLSIFMLGIFYVKNDPTSCIFLNLGEFSIKFHLEFLGVIFLGLLSSLWCVTIVYSFYYFSAENRAKNLSLMSLCIVAASLVALSANIMTMFIFYEILTLLTIPLVFQGDFKDLHKYLRPLWYPAIILWLPAIIYISTTNTSLDFMNGEYVKDDSIIGIVLLLACILGISKAALVPFHSWLPAAMIAPHPVSAMLHSVAVVNVGLFCIFKIVLYIFGFQYLSQIMVNFNWLIFIPGITILYSGIQALMADDLKRVLAYSTIGQLATCLLGIFLLSEKGLLAGVLHMLAHGTAKIVLFFIAGSFYLSLGKNKLSELKGVYYQMPYSTILFCLSALSLMGAPLLAGHASKAYLYEATHDNGIGYGFLIASTILTCGYSIRVMSKFFIKIEKLEVINEKLGLVIPAGLCLIPTMGFTGIAHVIEKLFGFL